MGYYAGKNGSLQIDGVLANSYPVYNWTFSKQKTPVDISNTNAFGTEQYIGNLIAGVITAEGYVDDLYMDEIDAIEQGKYVKFELYFDFTVGNKVGFYGNNAIDAIIDDITYGMDINGAATFTIRALLSTEPL